MKIDLAEPYEIMDVATRMRERDFQEFSALYPADDRIALGRALVERYAWRKDVLCARESKKGLPIAIGGAIETRPNVLSLLFFATDDFPKIGLAVTKFITQRLFPPLVDAGVHRIECASLDGYEDVHRWIETLGLKREGVPKIKYGKRGESFVDFAWTGDVRSHRAR